MWISSLPSPAHRTCRQGACYLIEDSTSGRHRVRCNARMADMFVSTEEMQALVAQTGLAVGHLMMRCVVVCIYIYVCV